MEVLHRQLSRYAVFEVESEAEALQHLTAATAHMYDAPPRIIGFNEDGSLVSEQKAEDDEEEWRDHREAEDTGEIEEYEDETISLSQYAGGTHLLTIELFNDFEDPNDPLYTDNIVLARRMEKLCGGQS